MVHGKKISVLARLHGSDGSTLMTEERLVQGPVRLEGAVGVIGLLRALWAPFWVLFSHMSATRITRTKRPQDQQRKCGSPAGTHTDGQLRRGRWKDVERDIGRRGEGAVHLQQAAPALLLVGEHAGGRGKGDWRAALGRRCVITGMKEFLRSPWEINATF